MDNAWKSLRQTGREPTARQVTEASGATVHGALKACRQFRKGVVPKGKPPGLELKTVRNVHTMMHAPLVNAVRWRYVVENVAEQVNPPRVRRRKPTSGEAPKVSFLPFTVDG